MVWLTDLNYFLKLLKINKLNINWTKTKKNYIKTQENN